MRRSSRKFPALGRSLTALTLALAGACNRCDAPAQTKYSCNSIDPTAEGTKVLKTLTSSALKPLKTEIEAALKKVAKK